MPRTSPTVVVFEILSSSKPPAPIAGLGRSQEALPATETASLMENLVVTNLDHVRWVGGGSSAGKTAVTLLCAERFECRYYCTDEALGSTVDASGRRKHHCSIGFAA